MFNQISVRLWEKLIVCLNVMRQMKYMVQYTISLKRGRMILGRWILSKHHTRVEIVLKQTLTIHSRFYKMMVKA